MLRPAYLPAVLVRNGGAKQSCAKPKRWAKLLQTLMTLPAGSARSSRGSKQQTQQQQQQQLVASQQNVRGVAMQQQQGMMQSTQPLIWRVWRLGMISGI
jgi:hypothetical protein